MSSMLRRLLTPVGLIAMSGFVVTLLAGYVARELFPESSLGAFLATWFGVLIAFVGAWATYVVATVVLALAGRPCFTRHPASHV